MDLRDERKRLEAVLAQTDDAPTRIALATVLQLCGDHEHALAVLEPAVAAARTPRIEIEALVSLGVSRQMLGEPDAGVIYRRAIARAVATIGEWDPLTARGCWELGSMIRDAELVERAARIWIACAQPAWAIRAHAFLVRSHGDGDAARELYAQALAALDLALGDTNPRLVEVLLEAATAFDPIANESGTSLAAAARSMRERAVRIARATTGASSQRTVDALWALALTTDDAGVFDGSPGNAEDEAVLLYTKAAFLDREHATPAGLQAREQSLVLREHALGGESHALIPLVGEIRQGWEELGRSDEAEAFLRRCRDRVQPASRTFRNLTYSIAAMLGATGQPAACVTLWRELLATREATCAAGSPELVEARELVAKELAALGEHGQPPEMPTSPTASPSASTLIAAPAVVDVDAGRIELDLRHGFARPALREVLAEASELRVTVAYVEEEYPRYATNAHDVLAVIAEAARTLSALAIVQATPDSPPADLATFDGCAHADPPLWPRLPALERLELAGHDLVHALAHPRLVHLVLRERPVCTEGTWELPALHTLEWTIAADADFATIDPVWTQSLPALRELVLRASFYDCDAALDRDDVRARIHALSSLELPVTMLGDDPIDTLLAHAEHLRHLARLVVRGADANDARIARLSRELPSLRLE